MKKLILFLLLSVCLAQTHFAQTNLWGMTASDYSNLTGVIFKTNNDGTGHQVVYNFPFIEGSTPYGAFTAYGTKFYGMTSRGNSSDEGILFEYDPSTKVLVKKINFNLLNGANPRGSLIAVGNKLYGMTMEGGQSSGRGYGTLFEYDPATGILTTKVVLSGVASGQNPTGDLYLWGTKLYGMTSLGGANAGGGILFEYDPASGVFTKKIDFSASTGNHPQGSLIGSGTKLYGLTKDGGVNGLGVLFEYDPVTNIYIKKIDFNGVSNGSYPNGTLSKSGTKLYGVARSGGVNNFGTLFEYDPSTSLLSKKVDFNGSGNGGNPGKITLLPYNNKLFGVTDVATGVNPCLFEYDPSLGILTNRANVFGTGSLVMLGSKMYGMSYRGGGSDGGFLYEYDPSNQVLTKHIDLNNAPNGSNPYGSLITINSKLYGMTLLGGANNSGTLFEFDPNTLIFTKKIDLISSTKGSLVVYGNKLYGTCGDGVNNLGILFEYDPITGILTKKIDFNGINGSGPVGSLVVFGSKLYGMTNIGGSGGLGSLYEYDPSTAVLTTKISFNISTGHSPFGSLYAYGAKLYGMTFFGGVADAGTLFEYDPSTAVLIKKFDFSATGLDGSYPRGSLVSLGAKLYGLTTELKVGYWNNVLDTPQGTLFEYDPATNNLVTKYHFDNASGFTPMGSLAVSGSKLYGMAGQGGSSGLGTLFEYNPSTGLVQKKTDFTGTNGSVPKFTQLLSYSDCPLPVLVGTITGSASECIGATAKTYSITAATGATGYTWTVPAGASMTSGANTNSITVSFGSTSGTVSVIPTNSCGNGTAVSLAVTVNTIPVTGAITGLASLCSGAIGQNYWVTSTAGSSYSWTVPAGTTIVSGQGTASVTVNFGTTGGNISVTETNANGCVGSPSILAITIKPLATNALVISGPTPICVSKTNNIFTVSNVTAGNTYTWTVPAGATIVSGQGTTSVTVNWGTTAGSVTVTESNSCGTGAVYSYAVAVTPLPNNALTVTGPAAVCASKTNNVFTVTNPAAGATYTWTVPATASIVSGQNTATLTANWGNVAGSVTVKEVNTCGTGTAVSKAVTITAPYALGNVDAFCGSTFCVPLKTNGAIANGIIGIDFAINYNSAVLTPTGVASVGPVATTYGYYSLNTNTAGKVYVSVSLNGAPSGTYFKGTGDIICVSFTVNAGAAIGTAFTLSTDGIEESTPVTTNMNCQVVPLNLTVNGALGGSLLYRNVAGATLNYDPANPSAYVATNVTGVNASCLAPSTAVSKPDLSGNFKYNTANGVKVKIDRDIQGDFNVPALNCSNVQSAINSVDRIQASDIATLKTGSPSIYALLSSDVNLDGKVTAGDVSLISSRSINANNCEFPQSNYIWNGSALVTAAGYVKSQDWLFIDDATLATTAFTTAGRNTVPKVPVCMPAPTGTASCTPVSSATYHAILLGDVDGNWTSANGAQMRIASTDALVLNLNQASTNVQGNYLIPVYYQTSGSYSGMDFSIDYNNSLAIQDVISNSALATVGTEFNNIESQRLMVTSYTNNPVNTSLPVSYIEVSSGSGKIKASDFSNSQAYLNGEPVAMKFAFDNTVATDEADIKIFPNPFGKEAFINAADEAAFVKVVVISVSGVTVYENSQVPSNEDFRLDAITEAGVYFVKIIGSKGTVTKKLVKF